MKLSLFATLVASTAAAANIVTSYSHQRPLKHVFDRSLGRDTPTARALKLSVAAGHGRFTHAARQVDGSNESVIGGAVVAAPNIVSATGTFIVPEARQPISGPTANSPSTSAASFWVGIDGVTCTTAVLRAGVDIFWDTEGTSFNAWYQVESGRSRDIVTSKLGVEPNDVVRITAIASPVVGNKTDSSIKFENLSRGKGIVYPLKVDAAAPLCRQEAAWMIEDFVLIEHLGFPVPLTNFSDFTFSDMVATQACKSGSTAPVDLSKAELLDIVQPMQGGRLTSCERSGGDEVTCKRVVSEE